MPDRLLPTRLWRLSPYRQAVMNGSDEPQHGHGSHHDGQARTAGGDQHLHAGGGRAQRLLARDLLLCWRRPCRTTIGP